MTATVLLTGAAGYIGSHTWLALHREGLVVFIHPLTGQDLIDHRDRAIWMGALRPLDLSVLPQRTTSFDL